MDDASEHSHLGEELEEYVSRLSVPVRVFRTGERSGLIRARSNIQMLTNLFFNIYLGFNDVLLFTCCDNCLANQWFAIFGRYNILKILNSDLCKIRRAICVSVLNYGILRNVHLVLVSCCDIPIFALQCFLASILPFPTFHRAITMKRRLYFSAFFSLPFFGKTRNFW